VEDMRDATLQLLVDLARPSPLDAVLDYASGAVQADMDLVFAGRLVSFGYDVLGLRLEPA
jgi:hypothetical protein